MHDGKTVTNTTEAQEAAKKILRNIPNTGNDY